MVGEIADLGDIAQLGGLGEIAEAMQGFLDGLPPTGSLPSA